MTQELEKLPFIENSEVTEEAFIDAVKDLRSLQHRIDDIARTASIEINHVRSLYNYKLAEYTPLLRRYWEDNAKVNKHGEKAKYVKSIAAGGGVYLKAKPASYVVANCDVEALAEWCTQHEISDALFKRDIKIVDTEKLAKALEAKGIDPALWDIHYIEAEAVASLGIGSDRAWSPSKSKQMLTKAIEGNLPEEQEKEPEDD